jgi:hypothetical protein
MANEKALRKLKLHVQMSIDGCIAGPNNEMDWMVWNGMKNSKNVKKGYMSKLTPFSWEEK